MIITLTSGSQRLNSADAFERSRPICGQHLQVQSPKGRETLGVENLMTLKQACSSEYQGAQGAFKDSMIHWILQFTLLIAFRCVLHRCESQEIRCWKLYKVYWTVKSDNNIRRHANGVYEDIDRKCKESRLWRTAVLIPSFLERYPSLQKVHRW